MLLCKLVQALVFCSGLKFFIHDLRLSATLRSNSGGICCSYQYLLHSTSRAGRGDAGRRGGLQGLSLRGLLSSLHCLQICHYLTPLYFCLECNDKWPPSKKGAMPVGYKNIKRSKRAPYKPAQFCTDGCYKLPVSLLTVKDGVDGREHDTSLGYIMDSYIFSGQRNPELPGKGLSCRSGPSLPPPWQSWHFHFTDRKPSTAHDKLQTSSLWPRPWLHLFSL